MNEDAQLTIKIDKKLKQQFKIVALQEDKPIKEILTEFIEKYVDEHT